MKIGRAFCFGIALMLGFTVLIDIHEGKNISALIGGLISSANLMLGLMQKNDA